MPLPNLVLYVAGRNSASGSGGGTTNYNALSNKPQINGTELTGNKTTADLGITAAGVGLGNVNNTSDADKPISNAAQAALNLKVDKEAGKGLFSGSYGDLTDKPSIGGVPLSGSKAVGDFLTDVTAATVAQSVLDAYSAVFEGGD